MKQCNKCLQNKEEQEFLKDYQKNTKTKYTNTCLECHYSKRKETHKKWRESNPDMIKANSVKTRYGVSLEYYRECMNTSNKCEHCGSTTDLCYDHDHETMEFRGVLCNKCNRALGLLGDTKDDIKRMLEYLSR